MIEAVIFDMDGVILDSEPYWQISEMEVFATVGIQLTREECMETTGLPVKDVVNYRYKQKPWHNKSIDQVAQEITNKVEKQISSYPILMNGIKEKIEFFKTRNIPIAVASSSPLRLIDTALNATQIRNKFTVIHSTELEEYGKPHPSVFLTVAKKLNVNPITCLVFEDSVNGLIAAKAARMKTVAIVNSHLSRKKEFDIADIKLNSLTEFTEHHWTLLNSIV